MNDVWYVEPLVCTPVWIDLNAVNTCCLKDAGNAKSAEFVPWPLTENYLGCPTHVRDVWFHSDVQNQAALTF